MKLLISYDSQGGRKQVLHQHIFLLSRVLITRTKFMFLVWYLVAVTADSTVYRLENMPTGELTAKSRYKIHWSNLP